MEILVITTGGTIEGLEYSNPLDAPKKAPKSISDFLNVARVAFNFSVAEAFSKDSRFITDEDRGIILKMIKDSPTDKILITHGTLTMVETARFLGQQNLNKTVVLVGAFILGTDPDTDTPFNLGYAISALGHLKQGVYIAMHAKVFHWDNVVKNTVLNRFEDNA